MRDVPRIMDVWRSGVYVGDNRPSTRVTVEKGWRLKPTAAVLGTWNKGPARWFQAEDPDLAVQAEIPNIVSVTLNRSLDSDAGTCDFVVRNTQMPVLGQRGVPAGQFGTPGYFTWDHGASQDAKARWGHVANPWNEALAPNALIRTYQGFGGQDKTITEAVAEGDLVLNGMWLIDDIVINTDGTLSVKCRDMAKLLIDQQLFPPLMPADRYPLDYRRWVFKSTEIPNELIANDPPVEHCYHGRYWHSSADEYYGEWNTHATGHPGSDAFDMSPEPGPDIPGAYAHQWTFWLSEPKGSQTDTVWIEFEIDNGNAGDINQIYYHAWRGAIDGNSVHRVMVSVFEHGKWVSPETELGGITPEGIPYVSTFVPGTELTVATGSSGYNLPRDYRATKIRLTVTNLIMADDFEWWRGGARKIMACFSRPAGSYVRFGMLVLVGDAIPKNTDNRMGYWQVRANGQVFAFGDARVYEPNSPFTGPISTVIGMAVHPSGNGYWLVDIAGRVVSAGDAQWFGDLSNVARSDVSDICAAPGGTGYWILTVDGHVHHFGTAADHGDSLSTGLMPDGAAVHASSIESHPTINGYWVLHSDGVVTAHNLPHHGNANRDGFQFLEWVTCLRRTVSGSGYWILSGTGIIQSFGDAPHHGNRDNSGYDPAVWFLGLCWELIPSSLGDGSYAMQSADGHLFPRGTSSKEWGFGSLGTGKMQQRFDGNYKDYADIIRDLALWAGFYLYVDPPEGGFPGIYGNIESTGAYAEAPLPKDMFDKKPVIDSIKALKDIVGYAVWIDAEGGIRFESPNIWTVGNFLLHSEDGQRVPFNYMPEIDETQQLLGHSVTRSASQARSRIIISTADPYPTIPGQTVPKGVVTTEIVPRSEPDLRGLVVPAMWINGQFLSKDEQKTMGDLIDMRTWFARRTGNVSCVANPLLDVNDQVRVIERLTGDVYVHYIRSINISHDLVSGDFRMDLTTHWMGGTPYGAANYYFATDMNPTGDGYWQVTASGEIFAYGNANLYDSNEADSHIETIVGFRSTPTGLGYYSLDISGKILTYGDAYNYGQIHDPDHTVIDVALTPSGEGYWILQKNGAVSGFGDAVHYGNADVPVPDPSLTDSHTPFIAPSPGAPVTAQSIESHPSTQGYWVLLSNGEVQAFNLTHHGNANRTGYTPEEYAACLRASVDGGGYYIPSGGGGIMQTFGNAVNHGVPEVRYPDGQWSNGLVWDMLVGASGYALQRADGNLEAFDFTVLGSNNGLATASWALVAPEAHESLADPDAAFPVSSDVMTFLAGTESPSANNAVVNNFALPADEVVRGSG